MKSIIKKSRSIFRIYKLYPLIFVFLLLLPSVWWLFGSGFYNMHDDLQVMRINQMEKCFWDGQIPCRWSPDMSFGFGQPMFNYYSATPYYIGLVYKLIFSASTIGTVKFLFFVSLVAAGVGMYLLAKEFWGFWGGVLSAILYTYAPYHAVDVYVRGALAESFSLAILPFLWFYLYKVIKKGRQRDKLLLAVSVFLILTTHNLSLLMLTPFTFAWIVFWLVKEKITRGKISDLVFSGLFGFGLASFFILPVLFEQNLIQTHRFVSDYYTYSSHFVSLNQLFFSRFWGDGSSIFGTNDSMSFAVGWPHWWILILFTPISLLWMKSKKKRKFGVLFLLLTVMFLLSSFMTHQKSYRIWEALPFLGFLQFPWRFLGLTIFFAAFAGGVLGRFPFYIKYLLITILIFLTYYFNLSYFTPVNFSRLVTDEQKFSGESYLMLQKGGVSDYLPNEVELVPDTPVLKKPIFISGSGEILSYEGRTNGFSAEISATERSEVIYPYTFFPDWKIEINGNFQEVQTDGIYDVIKTTLDEGDNEIEARFVNTKVRSFANLISLVSFLTLLTLIAKNNYPISSNEKKNFRAGRRI